jgi:hypothetical protein
VQGVRAQQMEEMKRGLLQSQIDENKTQAAQRQQQLDMAKSRQDLESRWLGGAGGLLGGPAATSSGSASAASGASAPAAGQSMAAPAGMPSEGKFAEWSQKYGIPVDALVMDYLKNGGKGISELISKAATPKWENINGNLVNTNAPGFQGGFQPGFTTSANGQVTAWQPDGRGGLVVGAPAGALDTYRAYQNASADVKPIKIYNPATGREEYTSEGAVVRGTRGGDGGGQQDIRSSAYAGGSRSAAVNDQIEILRWEMNQPGRTQAEKDGNAREIARLQGFVPKGPAAAPSSGNYAAGPSAAEAVANEANRARAVDTSKADVVRDSAVLADQKSAKKFLNIMDKVDEVFKMKPTDSGIGSMRDSAMGFFGGSTKSGEAAQRLKALGGWLVANVPRMEGPQSNFDVANYQVMAADVANDKLPLERRMAAAESIKEMMQQISSGSQQGSGKRGGGATGGWDTPAQGGFKILGVE